MLRQRVLTAFVLLLVLLPAMTLGRPVVWGLVSLVFVAAAGVEWARLLPQPTSGAGMATALVLAGLALLALPVPAWLTPVACGLALAWWLGAGTHALARVRTNSGSIVAGFLLLACWLALLELRRIGPIPLFVALSIVWVADIGAYFVGRALGRHRLAPRISPGKSWEGAAGGAALVLVAAWIAGQVPVLAGSLPALLAQRIGPWLAAMALVGFVGLSIIGDLHESLLKRQAGVKDSGRFLPGHGGVLDRVDALIPTMPLAALLHSMLA